MAGNTKRPAIRFAGFTEEWEQSKLGEVCSLITKGTTPLDKNITGTINFIKIESIDETSGEIRITQKITDREHNGYLRRSQLKENDILFSIAGTLGRVTSVKTDVLPANTNQALAIIRLKSGCLQYVETYLKGKAVADFIKKNPTIGAQPNLSLEQVGNLEISFPAEREQEKLGTYFRNLDRLITLHQRKYEKLTHVKKAMLEKMFPKHGSHVPEIRFKGFTDAWERRKLGEMADYKKGPFGSALKKDIFVPDSDDSVKVYEQQNAINKDWKLERYYITKSSAKDLSAFETHGGDIIVSCAGTIGEMYELPSEARPGVINQALMRVRVDERIILKDIYILLFNNMIDDFSREHSHGSAMKNIPPFADLKPMTAMVPSIDEQRKIGTYFRNLDHLITLQQCKLIKLQNIKKAMLEKMFPLNVRRDGNDF